MAPMDLDDVEVNESINQGTRKGVPPNSVGPMVLIGLIFRDFP